MDLSKLAESLGLPKDSSQEKVFAALAIRLTEGDAAKTELSSVKESLSTLTGELGKAGLRLDQGKLVKVNAVEALDLAIKEGDDEEKIALKKDALAKRLEAQKAALSRDTAAVEALAKDGRITPVVMAALRKLTGIRNKAEVLALSKDGSELLSVVEDVPAILGEVLKGLASMPKHTAPAGLSRLPGAAADPSEKAPEALANEGAEIAKRVAPGRTKSEKEKTAAAK